MDYEKMYKAVLKTATQWIKDGCSDKEKICLESIFPELRESEDERIRARLIEYFQGFLEGYEDCYKDGGCVKWEGLDVKSILAYLEKQKEHFRDATKMVEQKSAEWSEEDERIIDTIVSVLSQYIDYKAVSGTSSGYATPRYNKEIAWLNSLRPSWKPSEAQLMALHSVIDDESDTIGNEQLKLLYNDLKKL